MRRYFVLLVVLLSVMTSCKKDLLQNNPLDGVEVGDIIITELYSNFVAVESEIKTNHISIVDDYGHCWSLSEKATVSNNVLSYGELLSASYVCKSNISNLITDSTYYVRAFVKSGEVYVYGKEKEFVPIRNENEPLINSLSATSVISTSVQLNGSIIELGEGDIEGYGFCWDTFPIVDTNSPKVNFGVTQTIGDFSHSLIGLDINTIYYYKAYGYNKFGVNYGETVSFATTDGIAVVSTESISNISSTTVDIAADIISTGDAPVTEHGHCWSTNQNPTVANNKTEFGLAQLGSYTSSILNLYPVTTYYVRAYVENSFGISYGAEKSFTTTDGLGEVITNNPSNLTSTSIDMAAEVLSIGDAPITEHGHCWSTTQNPTTLDDKSEFGTIQLGNYTTTTLNLNPSTTYYYKAYITNSFGTVYGIEKSFTTYDGLGIVSTLGSNNISCESAVLVGDITSIGDAPITEHGHCWSTVSNPTISNSKTQLGPGNIGQFSSNVLNLNIGETYYYKAYVTNSLGTAYGQENTFNTLSAPVTDFLANTTQINVGDVVSFTDLTQNNPTYWYWNIPGATPSTLYNVQNPTFQFNSPGVNSVELTTSNACGTNVELKYNYIQVVDCEDFQSGTGPVWTNVQGFSSSLGYTGNGLYTWGGASGGILDGSYSLATGNMNITFWFQDQTVSQVGSFTLKQNNVVIWTMPLSTTTNWIQVTVPISIGILNFSFESHRMLYLDDICIE